ncbi:MAG: TIGR03668 family PPOX class F420-dependent oxidoreductase [Acidimicrobiia bacterium]|nr:TIGR03668 family PPOX class F420-dependent oxidoreductase [Acidimicrobiia bacterium]
MMRRRFAQGRVARLATVDRSGHPHLVPVCFAIEGNRVVTAVDHKPKSTAVPRRVTNIRANPSVSLLVDQYDEDWEQLWWVRLDGQAWIVPKDHPEFDQVVAPLHQKHRGQYGLQGLPGPAIVIDADRWVGWSAR